jgi:hypothetical protein
MMPIETTRVIIETKTPVSYNHCHQMYDCGCPDTPGDKAARNKKKKKKYINCQIKHKHTVL